MLRSITVGLDGSPESLAAAEWAACEAVSLGLPLTLLQVGEPVPAPVPGPETYRRWTDHVPRQTALGLRLRHPGVRVRGEHVTGSPADVLSHASKDAELLVLGSRGPGGIGGFVTGSVGLGVLAHAQRPVVFVRARRPHEGRPVVLGLDTDHPDSALMDFAFDSAARRGTPLLILHAWSPAPYLAYATLDDPPLRASLARGDAEELADVVRPWRQKFPDVEVAEESRYGSAAAHLVAAAREASLVVVGRRGRRGPFGTHIGHVTYAALHHSPAPVAVVSHG
ncbi:universal stress protein [Streptomyces roseirectus]|uniref:Universal stress protein n=1 Tax=Streptomyces roseirectus TaxID=2768066 RepID=A0A7H0I673_9ACTN|nr:universal stress protein [Streptomyces roseirectus]QNP68289.1 universal stress protein [Streptomyces roseirectus]